MPATTLCPRCATTLPVSARFCPGCGATTPTGFTPATGQPEDIPKRDSDLSARRVEVQNALGDGWEVRSLIGQGGFGEVWGAWDTRLKRAVAIKTLRADYVASEAMLARFQREAEAVARLRHPNIVPIYQVGEANGVAYFIMPLVQGESLYDLLKREGKLSLDLARRVLAESASALDAAHKAGIVHRDIKPENIMLEGDERRVLLMDFGIARALGNDEGRLTGTGLVIGTPQYMSPEQASAEKNVDARSDIYSLGVVAYQTLAGRLPFDSSSARELVIHHITTEPDDLRKLRADVPDDLHDAVMKCLRKSPDDRFASASALVKAVHVVTAPTAAPSGLRRAFRRVMGARGARIRIGLYVAGLIGGIALMNSDAADSAVQEFLRGFEAGQTAAIARTSPFRAIWDFAGSTRYRSRDVQVTPLGDSALLFASAVGGPMVYNGSTWHALDMPSDRSIFPPIVMNDSVWIVADGTFPGTSVLWLVTKNGTLPRDTIRHRITAVWNDKKTALLGAMDGAILRGRPGQWKLESTGKTDQIFKLWGDSTRQFASQIGKLLQFNGFSWRAVALQNDSTEELPVFAGAILADGTAAAIARTRTGIGRARWAIFLKNKAGGSWDMREPDEIPRGMELYGIWGNSPSDYFVYGAGTEPACDPDPCLYHVKKGTAVGVPQVRGDFHVIGGAPLNGAPYVLASSGAVWTSRNDEWGAVTTVPSSVFRGITVRGSTAIAWGAGLFPLTRWRGFAPRQREDVREIAIAGDDRDQTIWILTERGILSRTDCVAVTKDCRAETTVAPPDARRILDIEVGADGRLRVAGEGGLLATRDGDRWTVARFAAGSVGAGEAIVSLSARARRPLLALTTRNILVASPDGSFKTWHELGPSVGRARQLIAMRGGGAVLLSEAGAFYVADNGTTVELRRCSSPPTTMDALDDRRVVFGCAKPDDPLAGGEVFVARIQRDGYHNIEPVEIAQSMDVYGVAAHSGRVQLVGSGGFWLSTTEAKLPYHTMVDVYVWTPVPNATFAVVGIVGEKAAADSTTPHPVPVGEYRLRIRDGLCVVWDSTVDLTGRTELRLGKRDGPCK